MTQIELVRTLWNKFSQGDYTGSEALFTDNLFVDWPTSREYYETKQAFIAVNEAFGHDWTFEIRELEQTTSNRVISVVYVTSPSCEDSFYATSFFEFENNKIAKMDSYWAFQDKQPEWRKELSKTY